MASLVLGTPVPVDSEPVGDVERNVQVVLWHAQPHRDQVERRRDQRHPYPYPIRLQGVGPDGSTPVGPEMVVLGKHLCERGLDFYHREPLPDRLVIATFDCGVNGSVSMLTELTWCRFGKHGLYENGGRFVKVVRAERAAVRPLDGAS